MRLYFPAFVLFFLSALTLTAQPPDSTKPSGWSTHFQLTVIDQWHSGFHAKHSGMTRLSDTFEPGATSRTTTVFLGRRIWKGAAVSFNPELSGGHALSYAL